MRTLSQEFINIHGIDIAPTKGQLYVENYQSLLSDNPLMSIIQQIISNCPYSCILLDSKTRRILLANTLVDNSLSDSHFIGLEFESAFKSLGHDYLGRELVIFNNQCFTFKESFFDFDDNRFVKIDFIPVEWTPTLQVIQTWKDMIEVMLHRFRSPLTGVNGYLELLQETDDSSVKRYASQVMKGIDHIFNIMDEIEILHKTPLDNQSNITPVTNIKNIVDIIRLGLPAQSKNLVNFTGSPDTRINCNATSLKIILKTLITNGIEHTKNSEPISVHVINSNIIQVHNKGKVIPEEIANSLFSPFITSKATNLGIGLTLSLLHAKQFGGIIYLSQNSELDGITFNVYFP